MESLADPDSLLSTWDFGASVDLFGFGSNMDWGLDPPDVDFLSTFQLTGLEQTTPANAPIPGSPHSPPASTTDVESSDAVREAFRCSIGRWTPDSRHYRGVEEQGMSSKDTINLKVDLLGRWDPSLSSEPLNSRSRDKLLAMVLRSCEPGNISAVVSAFPTVEVLERLINISLTSQKDLTEGYIHVPTFSKAECRPETLAAVVIEGAVKSSSRAVQKFGLGLGEILGFHLHSVVSDTLFPIISVTGT